MTPANATRVELNDFKMLVGSCHRLHPVPQSLGLLGRRHDGLVVLCKQEDEDRDDGRNLFLFLRRLWY